MVRERANRHRRLSGGECDGACGVPMHRHPLVDLVMDLCLLCKGEQ
jgi:hypothetical protein